MVFFPVSEVVWCPSSYAQTGDHDGTGFLINVPGSGRCIILTAAHNLYFHSKKYTGYINSVTITFPTQEQNPISINDKRLFKVSHSYTQGPSLDSDYGMIILPWHKPEKECCGFGLAAAISDRELLNSDLSLFGYPSGKKRSLWGSGGRFQSVGEWTLRYLVETRGGQSGSPVFIWRDGFWAVVGIQYVVHIHMRYRALC